MRAEYGSVGRRAIRISHNEKTVQLITRGLAAVAIFAALRQERADGSLTANGRHNRLRSRFATHFSQEVRLKVGR